MKNEHEEMEKLLRGELDKEAQAILEEIEADESLKDLKFPDENEEVLMQKIQKLEEKKAACEEMPEKDREAFRLGREMQALQENGKTVSDENEVDTHKTIPFKKRRKKPYLLVAIVAVLAFAMSMTSIGEVPLVTEIKNQILGTSRMVKMNSEREGDEAVVESTGGEAEAYEEIRNTFDTDVVHFGYLPYGFDFSGYEVDETLNKACMFYQNQNTVLEYRMFFNPIEQAYGYEVEDELWDEQVITVNNVPIELKCYKVPNSNEVSYVAHFENAEIYYTMNTITNIDESEIIEILENLKIL